MNREVEAKFKLVNRLVGLFRWERITYLCLAGITASLLLSAFVLLIQEVAGAASLTLLLGSVGLLVFILGRVQRMWDQVDDLVSKVSGEQAEK